MKPDLVGAQRRWLITDIEKRIAVAGKHEIGVRSVDTLVDGFAGCDRSHEDPKFAPASEIDCESNAGVIRAHGPGTEVVVLRMTSCERASIEDNFF